MVSTSTVKRIKKLQSIWECLCIIEKVLNSQDNSRHTSPLTVEPAAQRDDGPVCNVPVFTTAVSTWDLSPCTSAWCQLQNKSQTVIPYQDIDALSFIHAEASLRKLALGSYRCCCWLWLWLFDCRPACRQSRLEHKCTLRQSSQSGMWLFFTPHAQLHTTYVHPLGLTTNYFKHNTLDFKFQPRLSDTLLISRTFLTNTFSS